MSFTVKTTVSVVKFYPEFQVSNEPSTEDKDVTYSAQSITSLTSDAGTAIFGIQIEGVSQRGTLVFDFPYSGNGNPLTEAEIALKEKFNI